MKKGIVLAAVAAIVSLIAVSCGNQSSAGATPGAGPTYVGEIKLGFIGPLSGDYANYGKLQSQAVQLAVDERNAAGGVGGFKVTLVSEDSTGDQAKAVAAFDKLTSQDKILGLIGEVFSSSSLAIAPKTADTKTVMISASSTNPKLIGISPFVFRTVASDASQSEALGRIVAQELKLKTIAILYTKNDYSQPLAESFTKVYEANGGKVVDSESLKEGDKDFKTQLTKIKAAKPEGIFLPDYAAEIEQILDQAADLGIKAQFVGSDGFSNPEILTATKHAEGVFFTASPETAGDKTTKFIADYTAKFTDKPDDFSKNAYDGANLILDALQSAWNNASDADKKTFNIDRDAVRATIAATKAYAGASGDVTFDSSGELVKGWGWKTVVKNGDALEYQQIATYTVADGKLVKGQ